MTLDVINLDNISKRLINANKVVEKSSKEMMRMATLMVQGKAKELAPVDKSTLRKSILTEYDAFTGKVGSNLAYAKYQEFGTGIYGPKHSPILPKRGKFLAWKGKDGQWIRARSVKGVEPKLFLTNAVAYLRKNMSTVKDYAARMIIKGL